MQRVGSCEGSRSVLCEHRGWQQASRAWLHDIYSIKKKNLSTLNSHPVTGGASFPSRSPPRASCNTNMLWAYGSGKVSGTIPEPGQGQLLWMDHSQNPRAYAQKPRLCYVKAGPCAMLLPLCWIPSRARRLEIVQGGLGGDV